ncbi:MAG TPA: MBL fold metallo-hydrolase [Longimicrobium sp.]
MEITFLGGAGTVTGSKYLVSAAGRRILVDCGLFQGLKQLRLRNREPFPVDPASIDAVILTHAHLDHTGYLPVLARGGFRGPVYCTPATADLCAILLPDSGHLQEEEARYAAGHGYSRHAKPRPLYTRADAEDTLQLLQGAGFGEDVGAGGGLRFCFRPAGHMLGAATVTLTDGSTTVLFSGDLGRPNDPLLPSPAPVPQADVVVVESTYGDRLHEPVDPEEELATVISRTAMAGGAVLIPSFAVGRAQSLLYHIRRLKDTHRIPDLPVFLDSPMAQEATAVFLRRAAELRLTPAECEAMCTAAEATSTVEESKRIDRMRYPRVIISASGMATGGRVLHHLKALASDPKNTILFAGYQAAGTRGADLLRGAKEIKIHGAYVPVRAHVEALDNISAHADYEEILAWLRALKAAPRQVYITHGEPAAADALRRRIEERFGWSCRVPEHAERAVLP